MATVKINNLTPNVDKYTWIVCMVVEGEVWFYGAWYEHQEAEAHAQARELNHGFVVRWEV